MHANLYAQILDGILYLFTHLSFQKCIKRVNYVARLDVLDQLYYASDQPHLTVALGVGRCLNIAAATLQHVVHYLMLHHYCRLIYYALGSPKISLFLPLLTLPLHVAHVIEDTPTFFGATKKLG